MEEEVKKLKDIVRQKNEEIEQLKQSLKRQKEFCYEEVLPRASLSQEEISRYSRQLLLPEIGVSGQLKLKQLSVLIIGAGGLGCPAGIYLAAAGVGTIGIVDHDVVEISNIHRQISHNVSSIGQDKSKSLMQAIKNINPTVQCNTYTILLNSSNIEEILKPYNIILDASDNVPTRYLLNDAAVLFKKPLVSGSALKFEGQLTVYNYLNGPCYRCLFPVPPPAAMVTNCSEGGVIGCVTGVIGCLQALEIIKIAIDKEPSYFKKMLLFDGLSGDFRVIKLRSKKEDCSVCGDYPSIKELIDYEAFCNSSACDKVVNVTLVNEKERSTCKEYKKVCDIGEKHLLIDVRPENEINICSLPNSVNIPYRKFSEPTSIERIYQLMEGDNLKQTFIVCRRGNDSQRAVLELRKHFPNYVFRDIIGGLEAWHKEIDSNFPLY